VTITANGAVIEEGSGERSTQVTLGGPGSSTLIRVTARQGASVESAELTLRPADVSLVLEPQTTGFPLYDGGLLVAPESRVRLVALTDFRTSNGVRIPSNSLSYTWRVGNKILTEESGLGRSVLTASAPVRYRNADVSVTVSTTDQSMTGYAFMEVSSSEPRLYAYRVDPLLGIDLAHTLSGVVPLIGEEDSFTAVPYYFRDTPSLSWSLNGELAGSDSAFTVRAQNESAVRANVGVRAEGNDFESASSAFTLSFRGSPRGFGF